MSESLVARLRTYNEWRRGADGEQPNPTAIGRDIDAAIEAIERLTAQNTTLRRLLDDARDSVDYEITTLMPHSGYPRHDKHRATLRGLLVLIDAALAAKEGENVT